MTAQKAAKKRFKDFESALNRLEEITGKLESGEATLEESIALYTEGVEIAAFCSQKLSEAEKKIMILKKKNAELVEVPFGDDGAEEIAESADESE
ncbi:Exodeoxyribonuclease 7 small subunit (modular protein) [Candidatus Zixiibacteriota bacterium]|nr:Exodeoxyribonuclease 7 small subunit (modular protein) [candidate division Zixibacteria bacterium]